MSFVHLFWELLPRTRKPAPDSEAAEEEPRRSNGPTKSPSNKEQTLGGVDP